MVLRLFRESRAKSLSTGRPTWTEASGVDGHVVQVYGGAFPGESIAAFLQEGLDAGEVAVVIATPKHLEHLQRLMGPRAGTIFLDAESTLARFMEDGGPDRMRFMETVGELVRHAGRLGNGRVRAFGEMVVLLCEDGRPQHALALERLWNDLASGHSIRLLCSYPAKAMGSGSRSKAVELHDAHTHVLDA